MTPPVAYFVELLTARILRPRRWGALALLVLLQALVSGGALAQGAQNLLTDVQLVEVTTGEARLTLNFAEKPSANPVVGDGRDHVELTLPNTTDRSVAGNRKASTSLIRSFQLRSSGQDLVLVIDAVAPIHVSIASNMPRRMVLTLTRTGPLSAGGAGPAAAAAHELAKFVDPPPGEDSFELVRLKYADVSEVVGVLSDGITVKSNDAFSPREPGFGSPGTAGASAPVAVQQSTEDVPLGQSVDGSIAIDRRLNAVWLKGSPAHIAKLKARIALIDRPVDSVTLETQFVELTQTGARNLGIDLTNSSGEIAVGSFLSGQYLTSGAYGGGSGQTSVSLQAAVYAQVQAGQGRIVSKPRIAAQSGGKAKIVTGDALPILTAITLSGVNGVSQQVQYVNVGVDLEIAPRVSRDGYVSSHIFCVVSSVTGYSQGYPTISQRNAETSVTVQDGQTFVIGGLIQRQATKTRSGIPLFGARLFDHDTASTSKSDLYILITPHITRRGDGAS